MCRPITRVGVLCFTSSLSCLMSAGVHSLPWFFGVLLITNSFWRHQPPVTKERAGVDQDDSKRVIMRPLPNHLSPRPSLLDCGYGKNREAAGYQPAASFLTFI